MMIQNNSKLVMIGDSISDFERARPLGKDCLVELEKAIFL